MDSLSFIAGKAFGTPKLSNFTIIFSNSKGNKLKYDSSTDTIIELEPDPSDEDDPDETEPTNSHQSYNFLDYKYLFFLILLLI